MKEILQLPCNQLFSCSRESLFPIVQTGEEERTGSPVHLAVLEAVEPETQSLHLAPFHIQNLLPCKNWFKFMSKQKALLLQKCTVLTWGEKKPHHDTMQETTTTTKNSRSKRPVREGEERSFGRRRRWLGKRSHMFKALIGKFATGKENLQLLK